MARPKRDRPDRFTGGEVNDATGLPRRAVQQLRDFRLGPFAERDQAGGVYDEDTLAELAMIAGVMGAGYSLSLAPALVTAFLSEHPGHPAARFCGIDHMTRSPISREGTSWLHRYVILRRRTGDRLAEAHDADNMLFVADRELVLSGTRGAPRLPRLVAPGIDPAGPFALGRMEGLHRGGEPTFTPWPQPLGWPDPAAPEAVAEEIRYQDALRGAVAVATVNLSLAIRRAFARVMDARLSDGGPLWPQEDAA